MIAATNLKTNLKVVEPNWLSDAPGLLKLPHTEKTFWRGMNIYSLEDPAAHLFVILKGRVKIVRSSAEGQQKIVSLRYQDEMFGELSLTAEFGARRTDAAIALDTTRVAVIRVADFWQAARRDSELMQSVMTQVAKRLADANAQIESLVFENNHRRLARALLDLSREATRAGEASVRLTHEELAELIGSTREVVTGMMIEFRQQGMIDYKRGDIRANLPSLVQFLAEGGTPLKQLV